ncbi:MAG TPA: carbon-nitrogen hydrolase family protein [Bacillota bacterium]
MLKQYRVAAAHVAPVFHDKEGTLAKIDEQTQRAAAQGAALVAFAEAYLPGFPVWCLIKPPYDLFDLYKQLYDNAITVPGPEAEELGRIAKRHGVYLSVGISERSDRSPGTLWNTNLLFGPDGELLGHHRKLVPTYAEKLVWSNGDGYGLRVCETDLGRIGVLICGENTNPLARFALLAQGEQVHISTWPGVWPAKRLEPGREYRLDRAIEIRSAGHAFEGKVYNIVVSAVVDERTIAISAANDTERDILQRAAKGPSMVLAPDGSVVARSAGDADELVIAEVDLTRQVEEKPIHDITGGYNRFDVFELRVHRFRPAGLTEVVRAASRAGLGEEALEGRRAEEAAPLALGG